jgi:hypothetical protein
VKHPERDFSASRATSISMSLVQSLILHAVTMRNDPNRLGMAGAERAAFEDATALRKACGDAMIAVTADRPGDEELTAAGCSKMFAAALQVVRDYLTK